MGRRRLSILFVLTIFFLTHATSASAQAPPRSGGGCVTPAAGLRSVGDVPLRRRGDREVGERAVPLAVATMVGVSLRSRAPRAAYVNRVLVRLHTPEDVVLDRG